LSDQPQSRGRVFVFAAPSGGGKTSLIRALIERDDRLQPSVSHTTRPARPAERDGEHYYFVDEAGFRDLIDCDAFLEYALVFGDYKGTSRQEVERRLATGHDVLLDIDWQGARQVRDSMPDSRSIFILPPSLEALHRRLAERAQDSPQVIRRRMRDARSEISHWDEFDFVVINDDFEHTIKELQSIISHGRPAHPIPTEKLHKLVEELLEAG
jgi:guanylate kinase